MLDGLNDLPAGQVCDFVIVASPQRVQPLCTLFEQDGARSCAIGRGPIMLSPGAATAVEGALSRGIPGAEAIARRVTAGGPPLPLVVLIAGLPEQHFPDDPRTQPILLRDPPSRLTLRVLRDFLATKANGAQPIQLHPVQVV